MSTWKERLHAEYYEHKERLFKLIAFLDNPDRPEIDDPNLLLLTRQRQLMSELDNILFQRLKLAGWGLSLRLPWMKGTHHCDWPQDFDHENGNYHGKCVNCNSDFIGHKDRVMCRECYAYEKIKNAD